MNIQICDFCSEKWPKHRIVMSRRPNDEELIVEMCWKCLDDIAKYSEDHLPKVKMTTTTFTKEEEDIEPATVEATLDTEKVAVYLNGVHQNEAIGYVSIGNGVTMSKRNWDLIQKSLKKNSGPPRKKANPTPIREY